MLVRAVSRIRAFFMTSSSKSLLFLAPLVSARTLNEVDRTQGVFLVAPTSYLDTCDEGLERRRFIARSFATKRDHFGQPS